MNGLCNRVFHQPARSSFVMAVNAMWNLCKAGTKSEASPDYSGISESLGTDF